MIFEGGSNGEQAGSIRAYGSWSLEKIPLRHLALEGDKCACSALVVLVSWCHQSVGYVFGPVWDFFKVITACSSGVAFSGHSIIHGSNIPLKLFGVCLRIFLFVACIGGVLPSV